MVNDSADVMSRLPVGHSKSAGRRPEKLGYYHRLSRGRSGFSSPTESQM